MLIFFIYHFILDIFIAAARKYGNFALSLSFLFYHIQVLKIIRCHNFYLFSQPSSPPAILSPGVGRWKNVCIFSVNFNCGKGICELEIQHRVCAAALSLLPQNTTYHERCVHFWYIRKADKATNFFPHNQQRETSQERKKQQRRQADFSNLLFFIEISFLTYQIANKCEVVPWI